MWDQGTSLGNSIQAEIHLSTLVLLMFLNITETFLCTRSLEVKYIPTPPHPHTQLPSYMEVVCLCGFLVTFELFVGFEVLTRSPLPCLLPASPWFLAWLIFRRWRWMRHVSPKCCLDFNEINGVISPKNRTLRVSYLTRHSSILTKRHYAVVSMPVWCVECLRFMSYPEDLPISLVKILDHTLNGS
jgi:hypothetical protein